MESVQTRRTRSNIFGGKGDFGFSAAHDSADTHGARAVAIGNHADARIELAIDPVESFHFFVLFRAADNDFVVAHFVVVKRVQRVAQLQHHVVRNVDYIADDGNAGSFKPVFQPFR